MNHLGRAAVLLALGVVTLRLVLTGGFGWFVAQRMKMPLLVAAIVLIALGTVEYVMSTRASRPAAADPGDTGFASADAGLSPVTAGPHAGHAHAEAGPRVAWLLVLPLAVLIAVAPTGLSAAAANRVDAVAPQESDTMWSALDSSAGPVELPVMEFLNRAAWDETRSLEGVTVKLTGIVVNDPELASGEFKLIKFLVGCCAADGLPVQVIITGSAQTYPDDTWVDVVGEWVPTDRAEGQDWETPRLEADSVTVLPEPPLDPYESW